MALSPSALIATNQGNKTFSGDVTFTGDIIPSSPLSHRNLVINGAMQLSQRGTSFTGFGVAVNYGLDRFFNYHSSDGAFTISQESSVVPTGFKNSLKILITQADASLAATQRLIVGTRCEGNVVSHLSWGTSSAETVTLSFYVRSSITGTHGGAINNGSDNRSYPFTYTISSANTWERKSITVAGDQTGTWATDKGRSLQVVWGLGAGSSFSASAGAWGAGDISSATGATTDVLGTVNSTWYLTGVQLELGTVATPFEHKYFADELRRCQRYCVIYGDGTNGCGEWVTNGAASNGTNVYANYHLPVNPRSTPTVSISGQMRISDNYLADHVATPPGISTQPSTQSSFTNGGRVYLNSFSSLTTGRNYGSARDSGTGTTKFEMEL